MVLKKITFILLVSLISLGGSAYASTPMPCASMMGMGSMKAISSSPVAMPCCKSRAACDCSIKAPSNEMTAVLSQWIFQNPILDAVRILHVASSPLPVLNEEFDLIFQKPPPNTPHLYDLYSIYRI